MYRSLRLSDSLSILQHLLSEISLSPVRWCWEQPSLILSLRPALPVLLSPSLPIPHMHASVFLSGFIPRQAQTLSSGCFLLSLPAKSPLCFSAFLPLFLIIYDQDVSIQVLSVALHFPHCLLITDSINSKWPSAAVGCWLESKPLFFCFLFLIKKRDIT